MASRPPITAFRFSLAEYTRFAIVLVGLLTPGLLSPSAAGAHPAVPAEAPAPGDEGGHEPEVVTSAIARTITPARSRRPASPSASASVLSSNQPTETGQLGRLSWPTSRQSRPHVLRC